MHPSRLRRSLVASLAVAALAAGSPAPALAQDSLPDPNKPEKSQKAAPKASAPARSSDLPTTGIEASWLMLAGVALLATGLAVKPAARLRRSYRTDTWENLVRSGS